MLSRNKYNKNQYIIISHNDRGIRQRQISRRRVFTFSSIAVVCLATIIFLSANALTDFLYQHKLQKIKQNFAMLSSTLGQLQKEMGGLSDHLDKIEEKDHALRSYADMPIIDNDIRKLGIGGVRLVENINNGTEISKRIESLELDVNTIARKIKLELSSYTDIYKKVSSDVNLVQAIPSIKPINEGYLNSGFGYRKDPFNGKTRFHYGQDITVHTGTPVLAPADGIISKARYNAGYGKVIKIDHGYGYNTLYAHLSKYEVKKGQKVSRGDIIGYSGNTGRSTAPHLHYEVHRYGTPQNPMDYFFSGYLK